MFKKNNLEIAKLGEEILRQKAKEVINILDKDIQNLIKEMFTCVKKNKGVGISAPQVFKSLQIMIISSYPNSRYPQAPSIEPIVLINPKITQKSKDKEIDWEGCLSIPGIRAKVPRHKNISIEYTTINNEKQTDKLEGFIARVFQHEYDHLNGLVFLDRIESTKDIITEEVYFKS